MNGAGALEELLSARTEPFEGSGDVGDRMEEGGEGGLKPLGFGDNDVGVNDSE